MINSASSSLRLPATGITVADALAAVRQVPGGVEGRALLRHVMSLNDLQLLTNSDRILTAVEQQRFEQLIDRRVQGEPLAYLVEEREFFGRPFWVTPSVLVPRPETELLVEWALEKISPRQACHVLDLGTGSGCIAISIGCERPLAHVVAIDVSVPALTVARENIRRHACRNVELLCANWLTAIDGGHFDIILSNPPYVASDDPHLPDLRCEPYSALAAGEDGLDAIRTIVAGAHEHLGSEGWLAIEHGYDQARCCRALLANSGLEDVFSRRDLAAIERLSGGRLRRPTGSP